MKGTLRKGRRSVREPHHMQPADAARAPQPDRVADWQQGDTSMIAAGAAAFHFDSRTDED
jgi:hypothetical protein